MTKGTVRSSQMVTTFGPGSLLDLPSDSVIVAGLEHWRYDPSRIPTIEEPRLVEKLKRALDLSTLTLRSPPPAMDDEQGQHPLVTAWRFPEWYIAQTTQISPNRRPRRPLVHLNSLEKGFYRDTNRERHSVVPVRFVRACRKGHVGDIEWSAFVHGVGQACQRPLWIEERGTSGDLDQVWVVCECGAERPMSLAARLELKTLGSCNGARPWLGAGMKEPCGEPNRLLIRSATNAYFPQLMSVISIPDVHQPIDDAVRSLWEDFLSDVETLDALLQCRKKPTVRTRLEGHTDEQVMASIARVRAGGDRPDRMVKEVESSNSPEIEAVCGSMRP